jgi:hypothetical protein
LTFSSTNFYRDACVSVQLCGVVDMTMVVQLCVRGVEWWHSAVNAETHQFNQCTVQTFAHQVRSGNDSWFRSGFLYAVRVQALPPGTGFYLMKRLVSSLVKCDTHQGKHADKPTHTDRETDTHMVQVLLSFQRRCRWPTPNN